MKRLVVPLILCSLAWSLSPSYADDPYNIRFVRSILKSSGGTVPPNVASLYARASDLYRIRKKPGDAINVYVSALTLHPKAFHYYELGNALLDTKDYQHATVCYQIAIALGLDKAGLAYYNAACAASLGKDMEGSLFFLRKALDNGYTFLDHIRKDADMAFARTSPDFERLLTAKAAVPDPNDFRKTVWGMNRAQVKVLENPSKAHLEDDSSLAYKTEGLEKIFTGYPGLINITYHFDRDGKLWKGGYEIGYINDAQNKKWEFKSLKAHIIRQFDKKYGPHRVDTTPEGDICSWLSRRTLIELREKNFEDYDGALYGLDVVYEALTFFPNREDSQ